MDLTKETIEKIVEMDRDGHTLLVNGVTYSNRNLKPVYFQPRMDAIALSSLSGLVGFMNSPLAEVPIDDDAPGLALSTIVIDDVASLRVLSRPHGADLGRTVFAKVDVDDTLAEFPWGAWLEHEDFIIKVRSLFVQNADTEKILRFTSKITVNASVESEDDGITQRAVVTKGASGAIKEVDKAPVIVKLRPYRTFREAEQPESEFLFRMSAPEGRAPRFALFEADGGRWRDQARINIATWLKGKIPEGIPIIF